MVHPSSLMLKLLSFLFLFRFQGADVSDMDSDQWLELLEAVTDDMQAAPRLGKAGASFPLAPAAKGKSGKVQQSRQTYILFLESISRPPLPLS